MNDGNSVIRIEPATNRDKSAAGKEIIAYVTRHTLKQIVDGDIERDDGKNFAHAALIAAAPDLLAVLKEAVANNMLVEGSEWWGRVHDAIQKAEA